MNKITVTPEYWDHAGAIKYHYVSKIGRRLANVGRVENGIVHLWAING
jgi:hypothetical protein